MYWSGHFHTCNMMYDIYHCVRLLNYNLAIFLYLLWHVILYNILMMLLFMTCNSIYELYNFEEDWSMSCGEHGSFRCNMCRYNHDPRLFWHFDIVINHNGKDYMLRVRKNSWMIRACLNRKPRRLGWGGGKVAWIWKGIF